KMNSTAELLIKIRAVDVNASRLFTRLTVKAEALNKTLSNSAALREAGTKYAMLGAGIAAVGAGVGFALKDAVEAQDEFQEHIARLGTALGNVTDKEKLLSQAQKFVTDESMKTGFSVVDLTEGLYQGVSGFLSLADSQAVVATG